MASASELMAYQTFAGFTPGSHGGVNRVTRRCRDERQPVIDTPIDGARLMWPPASRKYGHDDALAPYVCSMVRILAASYSKIHVTTDKPLAYITVARILPMMQSLGQ